MSAMGRLETPAHGVVRFLTAGSVENRATRGFILIDEATNDIVAAGLVV